MEHPRNIRRMTSLTKSILGAYLTAVILIVIGEFISPGFDNPSHIATLLVISSLLGFVGIGQTLVVLTAGIDLSIPYVLNAGAVFLTGLHASYPHATALVVLAVLALGFIVGAINGLGIAFVRIPPMIMTLGMNTVMEGVVLIYTNGTPTGSAPRFINWMVNGRLGVLPVDLLLWIVIAALVTFTLSQTIFGRYVYAIGNSPTASYMAGLNVSRNLVLVYALSGLFSALAGCLLVGFSGYSYLGMGDAYLLPSVAIVVIGGASILGGRGNYIGSIAGAIVLTILGALLTIMNLPAAAQDILYGVVILIALMLYGKQTRNRT
ncbi:MAG: ABC transporter permease [Bacilli bacterium]